MPVPRFMPGARARTRSRGSCGPRRSRLPGGRHGACDCAVLPRGRRRPPRGVRFPLPTHALLTSGRSPSSGVDVLREATRLDRVDDVCAVGPPRRDFAAHFACSGMRADRAPSAARVDGLRFERRVCMPVPRPLQVEPVSSLGTTARGLAARVDRQRDGRDLESRRLSGISGAPPAARGAWARIGRDATPEISVVGAVARGSLDDARASTTSRARRRCAGEAVDRASCLDTGPAGRQAHRRRSADWRWFSARARAVPLKRSR